MVSSPGISRKFPPLWAAVAVAMALFAAAAGPLSQTVRVLQVESLATPSHAQATEYALILNSGWESAPKPADSQPSKSKPAQLLQPLSGYFDTVSAPALPDASADVPVRASLVTALPVGILTVEFAPAIPPASPQLPINSGRAPPLS